MGYISTKCKAKGRHCDCVTGPFLQSGGVSRPNTSTGEKCECPCHLVSGEEREMFDQYGFDIGAARVYAALMHPELSA